MKYKEKGVYIKDADKVNALRFNLILRTFFNHNRF